MRVGPERRVMAKLPWPTLDPTSLTRDTGLCRCLQVISAILVVRVDKICRIFHKNH